MRCLLDTNILLRLLNRDDPQHLLVTQSLDALIEQGYLLTVVPQVLVEFYVVATRPKGVNGFGWTAAEAYERVIFLTETFALLADVPSIFDNWLHIVEDGRAIGKRAHDARIMAAMTAHEVECILTLNADDFASFPDVHLFRPHDLAG